MATITENYEDYEYELSELIDDIESINFRDDDDGFLYVCGTDIDDAVKCALGLPYDREDAREIEHERETLRKWLLDADYYGGEVMDVSFDLVERQLDGERVTQDDVREALGNLVDKIVALADIYDWWHNESAMCVA